MNILKPLKHGNVMTEEEALKDLEGVPSIEPVSAADQPTGLGIVLLDQGNSEDSKTQPEWLEHYDKITDGRVFAAMSDYYGFFKRKMDQKTDKQYAKAMLWPNNISECDSHLLTSTRIELLPSGHTKIIQHYGCKYPEHISKRTIVAPVLHKIPLSEAIRTNSARRYLKALFDTEDKTVKIIQTLEFIAGVDRRDITISTIPDPPSPIESDQRASGFNCFSSGLDIYTYSLIGVGQSRGASYP